MNLQIKTLLSAITGFLVEPFVVTHAAAFPIVQPGLAQQLHDLDGRVIVLGTVRQAPLAAMLAHDIEARLRAANRADRRAWDEVRTLVAWERFRDQRLQSLRTSLGDFPQPPRDLQLRVTRTLSGDGYKVENSSGIALLPKRCPQAPGGEPSF